MPLTTLPSERIGRCTRMRRFFVRSNRSESFVRTRSSAGFTIITSGFEFSVRTGIPVTPDNFNRADTDLLAATTVKDGGFGKYVHHASYIRSTRRSYAPTATRARGQEG